MARIRTIKPELPRSFSMGRVSRDARLTFIYLFTIADDAGRLPADHDTLAGTLFPRDRDAHDLLPGWLKELSDQGCIREYEGGGQPYIQICKWGVHQKIDHPQPSKIPPFNAEPDLFAKDREENPLDQGPRIKDQDQGPGKGTRRGAKPRTPIDPDWKPCEADYQFVIDRGGSREWVDWETPRFVAWGQSSGTLSADWRASWRTRVLNNIKFARESGRDPWTVPNAAITPTQSTLSADDSLILARSRQALQDGMWAADLPPPDHPKFPAPVRAALTGKGEFFKVREAAARWLHRQSPPTQSAYEQRWSIPPPAPVSHVSPKPTSPPEARP